MERRITLDQVDFRLLGAFVAVYDHQHVSRAADSLGVSQSTLSGMLASLRRLSGDPLFLRSGRGMQPSALAREWIEPIRSSMLHLERTLNGRPRFDPSLSSRQFVLYMSDAGQSVLLQHLTATLEAVAPRVRLQVVGTWSGALADRLNDGTIDVALGWIPQLTSEKTRSVLFKDRYVGLRGIANRSVANRYAVAVMESTAHQFVLERLAQHGIQPVVTTPSFQMLPQLVTGTALTAVVPERFARALVDRARSPYRVVDLPFTLPAMTIRIHWSMGAHHDKGVEWLRNMIARCVKEYLAACQ